MISLHLTNALGVNLSVALNSEDDLLDAMRAWGRKRYRTITLPYAGLHFPLAMADTFDWSIIGAQEAELKSDDGVDKGVWFENRFYKRRDLPATTGKVPMEACVKYSRGAKDTDKANPAIYVEGEGLKSYVTLVFFRGTGKVQAEYEIKNARPKAVAPAPDPDSDDAPITDALIADIRSAGRERRMSNTALIDLSVRTIDTPGYHTTTSAKGRELLAAIRKIKGAA